VEGIANGEGGKADWEKFYREGNEVNEADGNKRSWNFRKCKVAKETKLTKKGDTEVIFDFEEGNA
jgi:hypothetical protein